MIFIYKPGHANLYTLGWISFSGFVQQKFNLSVRVRDNTFYPGAGVDPGFCWGGGAASEAKSFRCSEAEYREQSELFATGVQGPILKAFGFSMLKYAFSHILVTLSSYF